MIKEPSSQVLFPKPFLSTKSCSYCIATSPEDNTITSKRLEDYFKILITRTNIGASQLENGMPIQGTNIPVDMFSYNSGKIFAYSENGKTIQRGLENMFLNNSKNILSLFKRLRCS
ncbi:hypothetical protein WA026_009800 [Henosepilachna vigintioctopunctata]|uniref:Uncharacterized protein n=1 Tax=Henosepilachna vigintioctopunctata TaxID=420089 RepID=A0AAW1TL00_9CUCU